MKSVLTCFLAWIVLQVAVPVHAQEAVALYENFNSSLLIPPHKFQADDFGG